MIGLGVHVCVYVVRMCVHNVTQPGADPTILI